MSVLIESPLLLLLGAVQTPATAEPVPAEAPPEDAEDLDEEETDGAEIVVTGRRPRGSVVGDIPPEITLGPREIRSYGASNVAELLDALAPQTRSARGRGEGRPVVLLNGRRISGFSEIRDLPPEAIVRVEILPEEVALKYGYRADRRVVNFVLRERFAALTLEAEGGFATAGGRAGHEADANYLRIDQTGRWSIDAEYSREGALLESERDLVRSSPRAEREARFRTLLSETDELSLNGTLNRSIGDVSATVNARVDASKTGSGLGLTDTFKGTRPLLREGESRTGHLGLALNGDVSDWRWSLTGNYDHTRSNSQTRTDLAVRDRSRSVAEAGNAELVLSGDLIKLPAGDVSTTLKAGFETLGFDSEGTSRGTFRSADLSRQAANAQANVDVPIASRRRDVLSGIGDLSANLNLAVDRLSDFGTLKTVGYGFNWSPDSAVRMIFSVTDEDGAPSVQQLGNPFLITPNVPVFDFVRGETVDVTRIDGGNPALLADNRRVMKLGLNVKPLKETDLSLSADYSDSRLENPIASFPTVTPEIEAAFPDRFVRDAAGRLASIDSRAVNFARADRKELRWGFNFSKPLQADRRPGAGGDANPRQGRRREGQAGERSRGPGGGFGGDRFGGGGRGGRGGRINVALYHSWHLQDEVLIRDGVPELDYLNGSAAGNSGGRPRHELELQGGWFRNGLGARLGANWQSGTIVRGGTFGGETAGDLRFSSLATANLRLFANLGQQRELVRKHPWLRGSRISLRIDNVFDRRVEVRDAAGIVPLGYQSAYLDPLGRSVRLSFRKLLF